MLRSKRRPDPGQYGHHCGGGQFATYEEQSEEALQQRQPDPGRYGHHCGGGQLAAQREQPEEAPRR